MHRYLNPFFFLQVSSEKDELIQQNQFLLAQLKMARSRIPAQKIHLTDEERQELIALGQPIRPALRVLMILVTYRTFCRWTQEKPVRHGSRKGGRPRTAKVIREVIIRIAKETGWGYTRIIGELYKLRIRTSRNTVKRILKEADVHPGPYRNGSWSLFLKSHWQTLWACDFFTKKVITSRGIVECYVLFFIHLQSRKVYYAGSSVHPNNQWVCQQARNFSMHVDDLNLKPSVLLRDRDSKFTGQFDRLLKSEGIDIKELPFRSPNLNAFAERWVLSIKEECLDKFMVFGIDHLDYLIREYVRYYNRLRPHQGKENQTLEKAPSKIIPLKDPTSQIHRKDYLGGVLNHYYSTPPPDDFKLAA